MAKWNNSTLPDGQLVKSVPVTVSGIFFNQRTLCVKFLHLNPVELTNRAPIVPLHLKIWLSVMMTPVGQKEFNTKA